MWIRLVSINWFGANQLDYTECSFIKHQRMAVQAILGEDKEETKPVALVIYEGMWEFTWKWECYGNVRENAVSGNSFI